MNTALIKPEWSFVTIALMVLGFVLFWPLGLAVLAYIIWGERFGGSAGKAEAWIDRKKSWMRSHKSHRYSGQSGFTRTSGNAAFDDYRSEQMKRLDEERRRLDEEINEFHDYMRHLHMARDREEFDRFMRDRNRPAKDVTPQDQSDDNRDENGHRQGY